MPHWRSMLTSDNFCSADLWVERTERFAEIDVEIVEIKRGEVIGDGGRKKGMPFMTMRSVRTGQVIPKPLGLNATNCNTIASLAGSVDVRKWPGMLITLFVMKTQVGREQRDAIRIRPELAKRPGAKSEPPADRPKEDVTPGKVEESLKREGLIDETTKEQTDRAEKDLREEWDRRKETAERALGRELSGNDQLTDADKRAIEMAEAEEARRG